MGHACRVDTMNTPVLLTRDIFKEKAFSRDRHTCVFCSQKAVDAHHILDRSLFSDGGYYLDNGASVCVEHHLQCEMTIISVERVREACGITRSVLPEHFYADMRYDKWGNPILGNGQRVWGELFHNSGVQKMLAAGGVLDLFSHWVKYQRTYHVPWSLGITDDDRVLKDMSFFEGKYVVVTEKGDGENTTLYQDHIHARSIDSINHPSRNWVKGLWGKISYLIPKHWRVCGENMYAVHSIAYQNLPSYFLGFSIWDETNTALSWSDTLEYFDLLGISPVKELYRGIYDEKAIRALYRDADKDSVEGYVIRLEDAFHYRDFRRSVAKFVRKGHVQTDEHWMNGEIKANGLAK
jgi:hypothetical protein